MKLFSNRPPHYHPPTIGGKKVEVDTTPLIHVSRMMLDAVHTKPRVLCPLPSGGERTFISFLP